MKLAIMQPYLFPYIGYWQLINTVDKFIILDDVTYINKGWINRNNILVNGKSHLFTVPLKKANQNIMIRELELAITKRWKYKFLKTLEYSYKKAVNYDLIYSIINDIINTKARYIVEMHLKSIELINSYLDIKTSIVESSTIYNNQNLKGEERIIDICVQENAEYYINTIGGRELYNYESFSSNKINLKFLMPDHNNLQYNQYNNMQKTSLSIIDVLMFNNINNIKKMLNKFKLF